MLAAPASRLKISAYSFLVLRALLAPAPPATSRAHDRYLCATCLLHCRENTHNQFLFSAYLLYLQSLQNFTFFFPAAPTGTSWNAGERAQRVERVYTDRGGSTPVALAPRVDSVALRGAQGPAGEGAVTLN